MASVAYPIVVAVIVCVRRRAPCFGLRLWLIVVNGRGTKRGDRALDETCIVCERHFESRFIQHSFQMTINGKVAEIPRD